MEKLKVGLPPKKGGSIIVSKQKRKDKGLKVLKRRKKGGVTRKEGRICLSNEKRVKAPFFSLEEWCLFSEFPKPLSLKGDPTKYPQWVLIVGKGGDVRTPQANKTPQ